MAYVLMHNGGRWALATGRLHDTKEGAIRERDALIKKSGGGYKKALFRVDKIDMRLRENKEWYGYRVFRK